MSDAPLLVLFVDDSPADFGSTRPRLLAQTARDAPAPASTPAQLNDGHGTTRVRVPSSASLSTFMHSCIADDPPFLDLIRPLWARRTAPSCSCAWDVDVEATYSSISYLEGMFTLEKDKQLKWSGSRTIKWEYCCKKGTLKIENLWEFTEEDQKHDYGYQRYCMERQQQSPVSEPGLPSVRFLGHRSDEKEWIQNRIEALYILTAAVVLYRVVIDTWKLKE
ncbi:unnamed protein product [Cyclocybe aegerita]|uniref:Uncharacterized protein n=1 Tax=Cyclocybe aegerita TaxID=1973307 RepID=A0A8S0WXB0_CYCAE|nr:unnamed protein product [Cyclocybe aegerita]